MNDWLKLVNVRIDSEDKRRSASKSDKPIKRTYHGEICLLRINMHDFSLVY